MDLPQLSLFEFGAANIKPRNPPRPERTITTYELEFYTDDYPGGTLTDGVFRSAQKGYYALYRPGQRQKLIPPYRCYYLNIATQDPDLCALLDGLPSAGLLWNMDSAVDLLREMILYRDKASLSDRLGLQSCVSRLLLLLNGQQKVGQSTDPATFRWRQTLVVADQYIRDHLSEDLSLRRLAEVSRLDPTYFHKLYTNAYGKTPAQRILAYRIAAAKTALMEGELTLNEIAFQCGFSTHSYFSCKFKQVTGYTPSQYRKYILEKMVR